MIYFITSYQVLLKTLIEIPLIGPHHQEVHLEKKNLLLVEMLIIGEFGGEKNPFQAMKIKSQDLCQNSGFNHFLTLHLF